MADYEVSPAYIESLLRVVKTARRIDELLAAEPRLQPLADNPFTTDWHPAELLELLGEVTVRVLGEPFFEDMAYQAVKQRFGGIVMPLLGSAVTKGSPGAVFGKLDSVVKVAIKGAKISFKADNDDAGVLVVGYPRPVAAHTAISWRGVIRFVFEVTGKSATGRIDAEQQAPSGQALQYRLVW